MPGELISREALERIIPRAAELQASERSGAPEMAHGRCCGPRYKPSRYFRLHDGGPCHTFPQQTA